MRILVAIDGSTYSNDALDQIASRPWPDGSELRIVTVVNPYPTVGSEAWAAPPAFYDDMVKAAHESGSRAIAAARERIAKSAQSLEVSDALLTAASPARAILDEAERWGAELVVVGSHGYGAVQRFLLGSVSHAIATHAPCSVEIIRKRE
jgi:nucleotide-binding universal stress UspA family protein